MSLENFKLNMTNHSNICLNGTAVEDVEQELALIAMGTQNVVSYFVISTKNKQTPWNLPPKIENYIHTKTCTWIFIVVSVIIAKFWKTPIYLSHDE